MIQLVINSNLLREIDDRKLINRYARSCYENEESVTNDTLIQQNLTELLDWDANGDNGIPVFCSKFESIKRRDWSRLVQFIKDNAYEIELLSRDSVKRKKLESRKIIKDRATKKEEHNKELFTNPNYKVSGRGRKARPCVYEGRVYKSRFECQYKEGLSQSQLYRYLERTNQV